MLLPFTAGGAIDWDGFRSLLERTISAALVPAVNMDTGYVHLLAPEDRRRVLAVAAHMVAGGELVAGAYVSDDPGDPFAPEAYRREVAAAAAAGATPVIFPSHGLTGLPDGEVVAAHRALASECDAFIAFELSPLFSAAGRIYPIEVFAGLMEIEACIGAKHSSLDRGLEWERLRRRDATRPGFKVLTGNDLAIDMVMYGSDYLLGLSAFAPDAFARRDALWAAEDPAFHQLNDTLQYLGQLAFRHPVPAYKHSAATFLALRGWIGSDAVAPGAPTRPASDRELLADILERLDSHP
ncbi:dihydrodipicolinate synthase family protein [soil metagenome]